MLSFGLGFATPEAAGNRLFEFQLSNGEFGSSQLVTPSPSFVYGFSKDSDDTPNDGVIVGRGIDDIPIIGDWSAIGFSSVGVARKLGDTLQFLLDTDRDTTHEYAFRFKRPDNMEVFGDLNPVAGNFDGLNGDDIAVVRNSGGGLEWFVTNASNLPGQAFPRDNSERSFDQWFRFGLVGDIVLAGDFDGDGIEDLVAVREAGENLSWLFHLSANRQYPANGAVVSHDATLVFGTTGKIPVVGDWDGDGFDDIGLIDAIDGQEAVWTLQTIVVDGTRITASEAQTVRFGRVQAGQSNVFFSGTWASNFFKGVPDTLVDGPPPTGNRWSDPESWSSRSLPQSGETVIIDQPNTVEIDFDSGEFSGTIRTKNKVNVTGGMLTLRNDSEVDELNVTAGTVIIEGTTRVNRLTVAGGTVSFFNAAGANSIVVSSGSLLVASPLNAVSLTINGGVVQANAALGSGIADDASVDIVVTGGTLRVGTYLGARSFEMSNGQLILEYRDDGVRNPLQSTSPVLLRLSGGSVLSAAVPSNPISPIQNYLLSNDIELNGSIQFGNETLLSDGVSSQEELNERERNSYLRLEGIISGPGVFRKTGRGSVLATGNNTYDGLTIIEQGEMVVTTDRSFGSSVSGTELRGGFIGAVPSNGPAINVTEPLTINDPASLLALRFGAVWSGPVTIGPLGGSIHLEPSNGGRVNRVSQLNLQGNVAITILPSQDTTNTNIVGDVDWAISGTGNVILAAGDGLDLAFSNSTNTYLGSTTIAGAGTVSLTQAGSIPSGSNVVISTGARLINRSGQGFRPQTLTGQGAYDLGDQVLTLDVPDERTLSVALTGNGEVVKTGLDVLTLNGSNSFTGSFTVSQGTVQVTSSNAIPVTSSITLATDTTLRISNTAQSISNLIGDGTIELLSGNLLLEPLSSFVVAGRVIGTGSVTKRSSGLVVLSATNSYVGPTNIETGILELNANSAIPPSSPTTISSGAVLRVLNSTQRLSSISGQGTIELSGGTLILTAANAIAFSGQLVGTGSIVKRGASVLTFSGSNSFLGTTTVESGELVVEGSGQTGAVTVLADASFRLAGAGVIIDSLVVDPFGIAVLGGSNATLTSLSTNGLVEIAGESLSINAVTVGQNGILRMQQALAGNPSSTITIDGGSIELEVNEPFLDVPIAVRAAGATFVAKFANGGSTFNNPMALESAATVTFDWVGVGSPAVGFSYRGAITGNGTLRKRGANFLNLTGLSTFTGPVNVQQGELRLGNASALPNSSVVDMQPGAILNLSTNSVQIAAITGLGTVQGDSGSQLLVGGTNLDASFGGTINGLLSLTKVGTGTLTLSGANAYSGTTAIQAGALIVITSNTIPAASTAMVASPGILRISNSTQQLTSLTGNGTVTLDSGSLILTSSVATSFDGAITGNGNLTKRGLGIVSLAGLNDLAGTTSVEAGELQLQGANSRYSVVRVRADGTVRLSSPNATITNLTVDSLGIAVVSSASAVIDTLLVDGRTEIVSSGNRIRQITIGQDAILRMQGSIVAGPNSTIDIDGGVIEFEVNEPFIDTPIAVTQNGGTFTAKLANGGSTFNNAITLNDNAAATFDWIGAGSSSVGFDYRGMITGTGSLVKRGLNFLNLTGASSFSGPVIIQQGELRSGITNALPVNADVRIASGAFLNLSTNSVAVGQISGLGNIQGDSASQLLVGGSNLSSTFEGGLTGSLSLVKQGLGSLTLGKENSYTGATTVAGGSLILAANAALPSTTSATVAAGAELNLGDTLTTLESIDNSGVVKFGTDTRASITVLGNINNTVEGRFEFNAASLTLGGSLNSLGTFDSANSSLTLNGGPATVQSIEFTTGTTGRWSNLIHSGASDVIINSPLEVSNRIRKSGLGSFDVNGQTIHTSQFSLDTGSVVDRQRTGSITATSDFDLRAGSIDAVLQGEVGVTKSGEGELTISGANNYTGQTRVSEGRLVQGAARSIPSASQVVVEISGTLDLGASIARFASLDNAGEVFLRSSGNEPVEIHGALTNRLSGVVNAGSSTLTLSGDFLNSGVWNADQQELILNGGTGIQILEVGASELHHLTHRGEATLLIAGNVVASGRVTQSLGLLDLNSSSLSAEQFVVESGRVLDSGLNGFVFSNLPFEFQQGEVNVPLRGLAGFTKSSPGELLLNSVSLPSGEGKIDDGSVILGPSSALANLSSLLINAAGALQLSDHSISLRALAGDGQLELGSGTLTLLTSSDGGFDGVISGSGGLRKQGSGTFSLTGRNTYQGPTQVDDGTLVLAGSNAIAENSAISINAQGTLDIGSSQQKTRSIEGIGNLKLEGGILRVTDGSESRSFAGSIQGVGTIVNDANGTLGLSGSGSFSGAFEILRGTLQANGHFPFAAAVVHEGASLQGVGSLGELIVNRGGMFLPGNSPGRMELESLLLASGATLIVELEGKIAGDSYDQVVVNGIAQLDGNIVVRVADSLRNNLSLLDVFDLITYSSLSGTPALEIVNGSESFRFTALTLANSYRLAVEAVAPPIEVAPPRNSKKPEGPSSPSSEASGTSNFVDITRFSDKPADAFVVQENSNDDVSPSVSEWRDRPEPISPPSLEPITEPGAAVAAIDAVLAEGLSFETPSIASNMKPISNEKLEAIGIPSFQQLGELPEFPAQEKPNPQRWLMMAGGVVTTLLGLGTVWLAVLSLKRNRRYQVPVYPTHAPDYATGKAIDTSDREPALPREEAWMTK